MATEGQLPHMEFERGPEDCLPLRVYRRGQLSIDMLKPAGSYIITDGIPVWAGETFRLDE